MVTCVSSWSFALSPNLVMKPALCELIEYHVNFIEEMDK